MAESSKKLSIGLLYDDTLDSTDGVVQQVKGIGAWLTKQDHHVFYLCGESLTKQWAGGKAYSLSRNLTVNFNGNKLSTPIYSSAKKITQALNQEKPDVIHVQMPYSPFMAQRVIKRACKKSAIVGTFHILPSGYVTSIGTKILGFIQYWSLKKIDQKISVSAPAREFSKKTYGIESVVIPNTVDVASMRLKVKPKTNQNEIVFLGRLVKRKGCEELIRAFKLLSLQQPSAILTIAGRGPEAPRLEKLVVELGIADKVNFLGYVEEAQKAQLLARAQVACFPSLYGESFGIVLIEAMAAGARTVLGGDNPGYRSVLGEKEVLLINPADIDQFALRLQKLMTDNNLAAEIYDWQQKNVSKYDINVVGRQLLGIYEQAIANRSTNKA